MDVLGRLVNVAAPQDGRHTSADAARLNGLGLTRERQQETVSSERGLELADGAALDVASIPLGVELEAWPILVGPFETVGLRLISADHIPK